MVREGATRTPASSAASSQDPPSQADQALHHFPVSMRVQSPSVVATEKIRGKKLLLNAVDVTNSSTTSTGPYAQTSSPPGNV